jgi:putative ABC transport system permease protein
MTDSTQRTRFRLWFWLIRVIGVIVPRRLRADWRQEWEAELQYRELLLADWDKLNWKTKFDLLRRGLGAFWDALLLQPQRLEDEMFQDLRYGVRMLVKNPVFTSVAILTLALGIGANTAIFSVVNAALLRPLPYPDSERLMQAGRAFIGSDVASDLSVSEPKFIFLRDNNESFEAVAATQEMGPNVYLSDENQTEYIRGLIVSADFFRVLGVPPASGRSFTQEEDSPNGERVVILGDGLWRRRFGADDRMLGKTIMLNGTTRTVVGIMPIGFECFGIQDVFVPMRANPASQNEGHNWEVIGRLKPGVTPEQARSDLHLVFEKFRETYPRMADPKETFGVMNWRAKMTSSVRELLWILLGAVGFVLLIACANVANLQLTRAASRQKEMAIRMALGAGGGRLLRQLLTEGVTLALLGGGVGLLLALWGMKAMLAMVPAGMLPRAGEINLDGRVLAFALGASLLAGIVFSLAPALQVLQVDVNGALKEGGGKTGAGAPRGRLRKVLVVVEVALALTLTVGAGLLLRTFANLRGVEPGFEAHNVLTFEIAPRGKNYDTVAKLNDLYRRALEVSRSLPGVEAVALTNKLPLDRWFNLPYRLAGQSEWSGSTEYRLISPDYFSVMKMAVRQGRLFNESDTAGAEPVMIVNEAFARRNFAGVEPLGQQLCVGCEYGDAAQRRVVGVVNETKQQSLSEAAPATVYIPLAQAAEKVRQAMQQASILLRTAGDPLLLSAAIQNEMRQLEPNAPVRNVRSLDQLIGRSIAPQRFNLSLLSLFAGLGLLLAAVGIYGVMAYSVTQRTHEIGIRMALGAQSRDVLKLVVGQGMALALVGVVLGLLASVGLTRLLKSLLFGVSATDPLTFAAIALLLTLVAMLACYLPARRATKVNPLTALRHE